HLKQGRAQEAVNAFAKAIELDPEPKRAAVLNRKLAQAYLALEPTDAHLKAAEERLKAAQAAAERAKKAETAATQQATAPASPAPLLPAKLIISATKKLLDQAGSGKISFEEFKKAASVEYLTFPPPKTTGKPRQ